MIEDLAKVPPHAADPAYYTDWGDPREFTIGDMGDGECAGEVVSLAEFGFTDAESKAFEAQLLLDAGELPQGRGDGLRRHAPGRPDAGAAPVARRPDRPGRDRERVPHAVRRAPSCSGTPYHAGQFANYLFNRHAEGPDPRYTPDTAHKMVEEANLFIDAAHKAHAKYQQSQSANNPLNVKLTA